MKLTKFEHACFVVEIDGQTLIVDPGKFTGDFVVPHNVVAIVVTHEHPDHFDSDKLAAIYDKNPESILVSLPDITAKMPDHKSQSVKPGEKLSVGPFSLEFFGGDHAVIHDSIPNIKNLGVLINDNLYYPGDSFSLPDRPIKTLALPIGAPWLKISEAMDFLTAVKPQLAFPTHDAVLSDIGKRLADGRLSAAAESVGAGYQRINLSSIKI